MANMSYCRFNNTYQDLEDCYDHLEDEDLSEDEAKNRQKLLELCRDIAHEFPDEEEDDYSCLENEDFESDFEDEEF